MTIKYKTNYKADGLVFHDAILDPPPEDRIFINQNGDKVMWDGKNFRYYLMGSGLVQNVLCPPTILWAETFQVSLKITEEE